tara:strand:- start:2594 stop:3085 length:492 start_codon:yes stop_codon:yes gene_type:complete
MKKAIIILGCLLTPMFSQGSETSLIEIREIFYQATEKSESAELLNTILTNKLISKDVTLQGYKGVSLMLLARYALSPYKKIYYFNKGKTLLENAIEKDRENIELRYLRYTVQLKAPKFLNYKYALSNDLNLIMIHLCEINDLDLKSRIKHFLDQNTSSSIEVK